MADENNDPKNNPQPGNKPMDKPMDKPMPDQKKPDMPAQGAPTNK